MNLESTALEKCFCRRIDYKFRNEKTEFGYSHQFRVNKMRSFDLYITNESIELFRSRNTTTLSQAVIPPTSPTDGSQLRIEQLASIFSGA